MNGTGITWNDDHNTDEMILTGETDTATKLWGSNWRMPTSSEFQNLLDNCTCTFTTQNGVEGFLCTGKGDYKDNSIFLPAAGDCHDYVRHRDSYGYYWSSMPFESSSAYELYFYSSFQYVDSSGRLYGHSVRAVLVE